MASDLVSDGLQSLTLHFRHLTVLLLVCVQAAQIVQLWERRHERSRHARAMPIPVRFTLINQPVNIGNGLRTDELVFFLVNRPVAHLTQGNLSHSLLIEAFKLCFVEIVKQ